MRCYNGANKNDKVCQCLFTIPMTKILTKQYGKNLLLNTSRV